MRVVRDRRSSLRVLIDAEVLIYTERACLEGHCVDLSMGGMRVHSPWPTYTRRLVTIEAFFGSDRLRLDAELIRHEEVSEGHALAFRFVDLSPPQLGAIERIIRARLDQSAQRDYARAFEAGAFAESAESASSAAPGSSEEFEMQPVISGLTEAIVIDGPAAPGHTVVAAMPPIGPAQTVHFEGPWEDEEDTAQFKRVDVDAPGNTLRLGRDGQPLPPEKTIVAVVPSGPPSSGKDVHSSSPPAGEPRVPVELVARAERREPGSPEPVAVETTVPNLTVPPMRPGGSTVQPRPPDSTVPTLRANSMMPARPPDSTVPLRPSDSDDPIQKSGSRVPPSSPVSPGSSGSPDPTHPTNMTIPILALGGERRDPDDGPPTLPRLLGGRPLESTPMPPALLRGSPAPTPVSAPASAPNPELDSRPPLRPSQRALQDARALLAPPRERADARRPRVIVSIPHRTYHRSAHRPRRRMIKRGSSR